MYNRKGQVTFKLTWAYWQ